jgi:hypothetical protein|mmetsp:Transcript_28300/g.47505  ORF Transcript_28300/g.47505 Transcript_28300/m.47505 type:complete len:171 (-) Transcript_28300:218-730(-)|eukprot:CAMPEP_0198229778 /NCGR_PEP_ID=MMETSP1445-20131203/114302_1 /TAXON_ID=36898 /ORGANISM="Pyramimonas sp., Strain CCMP2087" /LENGTH=170 /DNA_ID=CAMNT_0043910253 /DNA_START=1541 /DNA_END=2053 /DNA_ORIENTATION=-
METSLRFDSVNRKLFLHAKEKFVSDDNVMLTAQGSLDTRTGGVTGRVQLRKKFFPEFLTRLDIGATYETAKDEVKYMLGGKKRFELSDDGLLSLDMKGNYSFNASNKPFKGEGVGRIELSRKIFNFTEDQDLKVKIGVSSTDKLAYLQVRENNWTLNVNQRGLWDLRYDL